MTDIGTNLLQQFPGLYRDKIAMQWQALYSPGKEGGTPYRVEQRGLPAPIWIARGLPDDGFHAWKTISEELNSTPLERPICVYIHIPFCDSHCSFCDCYAFALKRHCEEHTNAYTDCLISEIETWTKQGNLSKRPVTTVHLGGGTPTMLGRQNLERLVNTIRGCFQVDANTEWALETTSSSLDEGMFGVLHALGFRRLHIGVQSLQDDVRTAIGRRENASLVIGKIEKALSLGWVVSVDVIIGLPLQTSLGLLNDLDCLIKTGVEGFSIYGLQQSRRNRHFFEKHELNHIPAIQRYLLFQFAFQYLFSYGYSFSVFNHLAKGRDQNLYFTYPQRGEDLLALGTIADGVFGNYHYRHPQYLPYSRGIPQQFSFLQGGLRRTMLEDTLHNLEVQILSGRILPRIFVNTLGKDMANPLIQRWLSNRMIEKTANRDAFELTANGAWFAGQLLQETRNCSGRLSPYPYV
jgi:coproporphyrinogen III oxidase-like Fe-S oxidoreductase